MAAARSLALYRGDFVAGLTVSASAEFDNWLYVAQESARRDFRRGTLAFARWAVNHAAAKRAVEPVARLVTVDPYCEDGHPMLIAAYDALHDVGRAAKAYSATGGSCVASWSQSRNRRWCCASRGVRRAE